MQSILARSPESLRAEAADPGWKAFADEVRSGSVPVVSPDGVSGHIPLAADQSRELPESEADLVPITDDAGNQIGRWGSGVGWIDEEILARDGFDAAVAAGGPHYGTCEGEGELEQCRELTPEELPAGVG